MSDLDEGYIGINEVANHYSVSISTVRAWMRQKVIPPETVIRLGKTYRFKLTDVTAALLAYDAGTSDAVDEPPQEVEEQTKEPTREPIKMYDDPTQN